MNPNPVFIVKASPRKNGNSDLLADRIADGLRSVGQSVELFELGNVNIFPCTACDACQSDAGTFCIQEDALTALYPRLEVASGLVIASPIYYFTVGGLAKTFIDRAFYAFNSPEGNLWAGKPLAVALSYADADPFISGAVNALRMYQDIARHTKMQWAGAVYGSAENPGDILRQPVVLQSAFDLGVNLARMVK
jgi:multimeric flavodoxin WrbA